MDELLAFIRSQKLMTIATLKDGKPWVANVFYGVDPETNMYFVSSKHTNHCQQILSDPTIAFNIAWFNPKDHTDRKAIQGKGLCYIAKSKSEIETGVRLHNQRFPEFADTITMDWIHSNDNDSSVWVIRPRYIKFWNDALFGEDGVREIPFQ